MSTGKIIGLGLSAVIVFLMVYMMIQDTSSSNKTVVKQDVQEVNKNKLQLLKAKKNKNLKSLKNKLL